MANALESLGLLPGSASSSPDSPSCKLGGPRRRPRQGGCRMLRSKGAPQRWDETPVSSAGCIMLPMRKALEVQKETGYEEEYQHQAKRVQRQAYGTERDVRFLHRHRFRGQEQ